MPTVVGGTDLATKGESGIARKNRAVEFMASWRWRTRYASVMSAEKRPQLLRHLLNLAANTRIVSVCWRKDCQYKTSTLCCALQSHNFISAC